jgi:hypothetical protein
MQDGSAPQKLSRLTLMFSAFSEKVNGLFAGNFQADGFESGVHYLLVELI